MIDMKAEVNGLNEKVVKMLAERKMTVSAAESCTGGLSASQMQAGFLRHL